MKYSTIYDAMMKQAAQDTMPGNAYDKGMIQSDPGFALGKWLRYRMPSWFYKWFGANQQQPKVQQPQQQVAQPSVQPQQPPKQVG